MSLASFPEFFSLQILLRVANFATRVRGQLLRKIWNTSSNERYKSRAGKWRRSLTCWYVGAHFVEWMRPSWCSPSIVHYPPHAIISRNNDTHTYFHENFRNGYCDVFSGTELRSIPSESLLRNGTAAMLKTVDIQRHRVKYMELICFKVVFRFLAASKVLIQII